MSVFLSLLLLGAQEVLPAGPVAVDRVKSLLSGFDVPKPYRLQSLGTSYNDGNDFTHVVMTDGRKRTYEAYLRRTSTLLWRGEEFESSRGGKRTAVKDKALDKRFGRWLQAIGTKETDRLRGIERDEKGMTHGGFEILRNGRPFVVSWQWYGYRFSANPKGEFLRFESNEFPPPVETRPPVLTEKDALEAVAKIYRDLPREDGIEHTYRPMPPNLLGYFLVKGEKRARLVWKIPIMSETHIENRGKRGGSTAILLDAISGEQLKTDVIPL